MPPALAPFFESTNERAVDTELGCGKVARFNVTASFGGEAGSYGSLGHGQADNVDGTHERKP